MKLEHRGPAEKEKEKLEEHEEQLMKTPEPPGPSFPITEPSVQMVRSDGGREERWPLAKAVRRRGGSEREQGRLRETDTEKEGGDQGGNGGVRTRGSRGEDGGGVRGWDWQKNRQDEDRTRFLTEREAREEIGKEEGKRRARSK